MIIPANNWGEIVEKMRPPICAICNSDLEGDEGGLIYFLKGPSDLEWDIRAAEPDFVGHPPYAEWFCGKHYQLAQKYTDSILAEALKKIKANLKG